MPGKRFAIIAGLMLVLGLAVPNTARAAAPTLVDMQAEQEAIRAETEQIGGSRSPATAENNVQTRINETQATLDRLHDVAESLGATTRELDELRQQVGDMPIVELSDIPEEGIEKAGEEAIKRTCTRGVIRFAWWAALVGDVVEYGGKIIIRELNEDAIRDMVRSERVKLHEVYDLISQLYCQQAQDRADLRRVKELRARDNALFQQIAEERARQTERARPARSNAVHTRETDPAGDEAERQRALQDAVRPANGSVAPPRPRLSVRPATTVQASFDLSPYAMDILEAHNIERASVGAVSLVWSPELALKADEWAGHLAEIGRLEHSPRDGRGTDRENLAQIPISWNIEQAVQLWLDEKSDFIPGEFPNVSRSWQVDNVLHFTQMIWPDTTSIGCGDAMGGGFIWFVCRYGPGGNRPGETVGVPPSLEVQLSQVRDSFVHELDWYADAKQAGHLEGYQTAAQSVLRAGERYAALLRQAMAQGLDVSGMDSIQSIQAGIFDAFRGAGLPEPSLGPAFYDPTPVETPQLPNQEPFKPEPSKEPLDVL